MRNRRRASNDLPEHCFVVSININAARNSRRGIRNDEVFNM